MFQSQINDLERLGQEQEQRKLSNPIYAEFKECIVKHDYSYMMSDSHSVWEKGNKAEKHIQSLIAKLIEGGENPLALKLNTLNSVPQQFNDVDKDGNDLTHRVIRSWFNKYSN